MRDKHPSYHVLVLAMSTLPQAVVSGNGETTYRLKKDGSLVGPAYRGLGQLEAIPLFIRDAFGSRTTFASLTTSHRARSL